HNTTPTSTDCMKPAEHRCCFSLAFHSTNSDCGPTFRRRLCRCSPGAPSPISPMSCPSARFCSAACIGLPIAAKRWRGPNAQTRAATRNRGDTEMTYRTFSTYFWRAVFVLCLIGGAAGTYLRIVYGLGGSTNLTNQFPWGIWIGFDILCGVGLAAGGFTLAATVHIFNLRRYKSIVRPAILTAFLGYLLVI